jgi:hypothetical protein
MSDEKTGSNRKWIWNQQRELAAQLLAEDERSDAEIGESVGITDRQIRSWKQEPEFVARIAEISRLLGNTVLRRAIARRASRVRALDERWKAMEQIIAERAHAPEMQDVPGGKTGLLVRKIKSVGSGENCQIVQEYETDVGLLKEMREHEKQAAQELGQWAEKHEVTGAAGGPLQCETINDDERAATILAILASVGTSGTRPGVAGQAEPCGHPLDPAGAALSEGGDGAGPVADGPAPLIF